MSDDINAKEGMMRRNVILIGLLSALTLVEAAESTMENAIPRPGDRGATSSPIRTPVWRKQHTESYKDWKVGETRTYPMICPARMKAVSGGATSDNPNVVMQATQIKLDRPGPPYVVESHKIYITVRRAPSVVEIETIAKGMSPPAVAANVTYWSICLD